MSCRIFLAVHDPLDHDEIVTISVQKFGVMTSFIRELGNRCYAGLFHLDLTARFKYHDPVWRLRVLKVFLLKILMTLCVVDASDGRNEVSCVHLRVAINELIKGTYGFQSLFVMYH